MGNHQIKLGNTMVGEDYPVYMIAEIGINHNGSLDLTKKLIDGSFSADWHCVKFQKRTPDLCVPEKQKSVLKETPWGEMTYLEYRHKIEFGKKEYGYIDRYCKEKPISWTASVWDIPSLRFILEYDVPFIKIPSAKLIDHKLLKAAAASGVPVLLSTGMSTLEEIDQAVDTLEETAPGQYVLMHTNSAYPTPLEELNLRMIPILKDRYKCLVGYSGHEYALEPTAIAVSLGARLIERHVTKDHGLWGSDQAASIEIHAMDFLHRRIKSIDSILGDGVKKITPAEMESRKRLRG